MGDFWALGVLGVGCFWASGGLGRWVSSCIVSMAASSPLPGTSIVSLEVLIEHITTVILVRLGALLGVG